MGVQETAFIIGQNKDSLKELRGLAHTAGVKVKKALTYKGEHIDPAYFIGKGNLDNIKNYIDNYQPHLIIFDNELTPAQHRNLNEDLEIKIIDRYQLIMNIFDQHANTK